MAIAIARSTTGLNICDSKSILCTSEWSPRKRFTSSFVNRRTAAKWMWLTRWPAAISREYLSAEADQTK